MGSVSAGLLGARLIAAGFTDRAVPSSGEPARGGVGDRLSAVPTAIADEIVGGRCTHRPPAGAPRRRQPPTTPSSRALQTAAATPPGARRLVPGHRGGLADRPRTRRMVAAGTSRGGRT